MQNPILQALCAPLSAEVKQLIDRNIARMRGELKYFQDIKKDEFAKAVSNGWSIEKIDIIITLITFYQNVIGPLKTTSSFFFSKNWARTEIVHGRTIQINEETSLRHKKMIQEFETIAFEFGIGRPILEKTKTLDLLRQLSIKHDYPDF